MEITAAVPEDTEYKKHSLVLTFESLEEAEAVYCIFSHAPICYFLTVNGIDDNAIRKSIKENAGEGFDYMSQWDSFREKMNFPRH